MEKQIISWMTFWIQTTSVLIASPISYMYIEEKDDDLHSA